MNKGLSLRTSVHYIKDQNRMLCGRVIPFKERQTKDFKKVTCSTCKRKIDLNSNTIKKWSMEVDDRESSRSLY